LVDYLRAPFLSRLHLQELRSIPLQHPGSAGRVAGAANRGTPRRALSQCDHDPVTTFGHNVRMSEEYPLTLRQADQARTDFAMIESNLEFIAGQLARVPTRGDLAKAALGIIFCSAVFTTLFVWIVWH
jgi:hypothetical protein